MACHDAVFRAGGGHADDLLRAEIGREKRQAGDPGGNQSSGKKKIRACAHVAFQHKANAEDEGEIDDQNGAVDQTEVNGLHRKSGQPALQPLAQNSRWRCHLRDCERFQ